ncbi:MAG: hypothetical protein ACT4TC_03210 [Myxococcaceae bacterium]
MKTTALLALMVLAVGCGRSYPHDPVPCTDDSQCATSHKCLPEWTRSDAGACLSTRTVCRKPCTTDADCSYCGLFTVCAVDACDTSGPTTCSVFCGDGK